MALTSGTRLGPYEILSALGAGGMGEVYRAKDTKLNRDVAIKVLPDSLAGDRDRLARFEREAQVLGALNHPNIAHIHGFEDSTGIPALVMELVEGPTLAERIARGPLPIDEALAIAKQIADALEAAHEQGIIHRDLKPANIKVKDDGTVKVLDFGLAKAVEPESGGPGRAGGLTESPTITTPAMMTGVGVILGTAAYMSPEQAKGRPADKRSDVWAFGCVVYEMLTGKRAFEGEDVGDTLAAVLKSQPGWNSLPPDTRPAIRRLLRRCLEKDRRERLPDIAMARLEIKDALAKADADEPVASSLVPVARRGHEPLAWALFGLMLVAAIGIAAVTYVRREPADTRVYRSSILPPANLSWDPAGRLAVSPDGRRLAFLAPNANGRRALWVQPMDALSAQALAGTDDATYPFWSADSRFLAFTSDGRLKKIDASGGPALTVCNMSGVGAAPGAWNRDNVILFTPASGSPIHRVAAAGGTPVPVTVLDAKASETRHLFPFFLPDGRHFLYVAYGGQTPRGVYVGSLGSTDRTLLLEGGSNVAYAQGFLIFLRENTMMAQPFDVTHLVLTGDATPLAEPVYTTPMRAGTFSVAETGVLVYQTRNAAPQLEWVDRSGKPLSTLGERALYSEVQLSPDGAQVSVTFDPRNGERSDIWILDVARNVPTRFTFDPTDDGSAVWSPDGSRIAFRSNRKGHFDLYQKASSGAGAEELLLADAFDKTPTSWSPDGRFILYSVLAPSAAGDVWVLPVSGDRKPFPFLQGRFNETQGQFSPDGRWVAYVSNETGRVETYVVPFPGPGGKWMISTGGGQQPRWRRDGKEILYLNLENNLMAAPVTTNGTRFEVGAARSLFATRSEGGPGRYDVSADGQRFLIRATYAESGPLPITLVTNWTAALKK